MGASSQVQMTIHSLVSINEFPEPLSDLNHASKNYVILLEFRGIGKKNMQPVSFKIDP